MGEDRNPASLWNQRAARSQAGQDSASRRPETALEPAPGCAPARRFPATTAAARTFRTRWPGDVIVTLATAGENAPPPRAWGRGLGGLCTAFGEGRAGRGVGWRGPGVGPQVWQQVCRGLGKASPSGPATALLGARSRPRDHHPSTRLSALFPLHRCLQPLGLALLSSQVTKEMPSSTTQTNRQPLLGTHLGFYFLHSIVL